jgi:flagellar biogenesis protein FliO|tara:strand:+ start:3710 stop:4150 length:441 start_codon:yes stop_codon:yes gene_type:complete
VKPSRQIAVFFLLLTFVFLPHLLLGQDKGDSFKPPDTDGLFWGMIKVVSVLVILGVIAFFGKDFLRSRRLGRFKVDEAQRLRVADVCSLGNRQFVFVIECGEERHLVGSSSDGVRYLSQLNDAPVKSFESELESEIQSSGQKEKQT